MQRIILLFILINISHSFSEQNLNQDFHYAVKKGEIEKVIEFLRSEVDVNSKDKDGNTALINAVEDSNFYMVKILLLNGADVNICDKIGQTALTLAKDFERKEIEQMLINAGAK